MRVLIIGAGAIGCLVGGRLSAAGFPVTMVGRSSFVEAVRERGLVIRQGRGLVQTLTEVQATDSVRAGLIEGPPPDLILLTVKAYDTDAVIEQVARVTLEPPPFLTLQNGVGNEEALMERFGDDWVAAGAITTPVSAPAPGVVEVRHGAPKISLAPVTAAATEIARVAAMGLAEAGFSISTQSDFRSLKWTRLLMQIPGNASSAILDWEPAEVFRHRALLDLEVDAWREGVAVLQTQKVHLVSLGGYPIPHLVSLMRWLPRFLVRLLLTRLAMVGQEDNTPSLHTDLRMGKRRSEVGWLNGAIVRAGAMHSLPTPVNQALTEILTGLVEGREPWEGWRHRPDQLVSAVSEVRDDGKPVATPRHR